MKPSSFGSLIALSALAVAPSALAQEGTSPTTGAAARATTPAPAPMLTTPTSPATAPASTPQSSTPPASTPQGSTPQGSTPEGSTPGSTPTSPGTSPTTPQALDPETDADAARKRKKKREQAKEAQAERDPAPTSQATDTQLVAPSSLEVTAIPNFFIEDFDIPPFLLPIYQAAGSEYGIRWEVLAAINRVETDFGRNLNVSSAGALGWMQFMPATWEMYGVDANDDGEKDPFNPADAIFAAARYLRAAGGDKDLRRAVFAYNHADWYVDMVLDGARKVAATPEPLISSLTALTQGLFPVDADDADIDYAGKRKANGKGKKVTASENAADPDKGSSDRTSLEIEAPAGSKVVAVQDGVVERIGTSKRLGRYVRIRDTYGNRYTYAHLGEVQKRVPIPKPTKEDEAGAKAHAEDELAPKDDPTPTAPATAGKQTDAGEAPSDADAAPTPAPRAATSTAAAPGTRARIAANADDPSTTTSDAMTPRRIRFKAHPGSDDVQPEEAPTGARRLFAHPELPESYAAGGAEQLNPTGDGGADIIPAGELSEYFSVDYDLKRTDVRLEALKQGTAVIAGTVLGETQAAGDERSSFTFEIRPAGKKAPRIDPRPIVDGWRLMDRTSFYKARAVKATQEGDSAEDLTVGQVLLMSKSELQKRVLSDKRITIYECGRRDIRAGFTDRRILALLEVLAIKGVKPTVSSLTCGHGVYTSSGNVSQHTTGTAVDIATVYGETVTPATQGAGSPTDRAVREILGLQGNMKPDQIITLMKYQGEDNTLAMADHDDHIHVGYRPITGKGGKQLEQLLRPGQWDDLVERISKLDAPEVSAAPSRYSVKVEGDQP